MNIYRIILRFGFDPTHLVKFRYESCGQIQSRKQKKVNRRGKMSVTFQIKTRACTKSQGKIVQSSFELEVTRVHNKLIFSTNLVFPSCYWPLRGFPPSKKKYQHSTWHNEPGNLICLGLTGYEGRKNAE